ncbi:hypothetical protein B194_3280 [Serratia plymuthica A30]|nr:hypothetical protein B194_3280 [Serratia plymuthica A30]
MFNLNKVATWPGRNLKKFLAVPGRHYRANTADNADKLNKLG